MEEKQPGCYGVYRILESFHISPLCPVILKQGVKKKVVLNRYDREADAVITGHRNRCKICYNKYRFALKINNKRYEYLLNERELRIMRTIAELHRGGVEVTPKTIKGLMTMTSGIVLTPGQFDLSISKLLSMKLISYSEFQGSKQLRRRRKFTVQGALLVSAYENKLYGAPLSETQKTEHSEVNKKLI